MADPATLTYDDRTPLYLRLAGRLRAEIAGGALLPGRALPSERDLSGRTGLSRVTVRKGIATLIAEGLLVRRAGSGTFVAPRIEAKGAQLSSFSDAARARGEAAQSIWVLKAIAEPTAEEAAALTLPAGAAVARLTRVRLADGEPLAIEHAVVPAVLLPDLAAVESLYAALEAAGARPASGTQRLRAALATPTEAGILGIAEHAAVLRIERCSLAIDGRPVELTRSVYRGDRYDFVTELTEPTG